jgi:hypothetical protein
LSNNWIKSRKKLATYPCLLSSATGFAKFAPGETCLDPGDVPQFTYCEPSDGGGPTGPSIKPDTPADIEYPVYSNGSFNVSWSWTSGNGDAIKYKLYQRKNDSNWTLMYFGQNRSKTISHSENAKYEYKVQACNTSDLCGPFNTGGPTRVAIIDEIDYETLYPGIVDSRVNDEAFIDSNPGFRDITRGVDYSGPSLFQPASTNSNSGSGTITGDTGSSKGTINPIGPTDPTGPNQSTGQNPPPTTSGFNLGKGFLLTEGDYAPETVCLKTDDLYVTETPITGQELDFKVIKTRDDILTQLDLDISADLSLSIGSFGLEANGKYKLAREIIRKKSRQTMVVKWKSHGSRLDLASTSPFKIKNYWVNNYLDPSDGNDIPERHFRNACGDEYVKSVDLGASLYVLVTITNQNITTDELINIEADFDASVPELFSLGVNGSLSQSAQTFFNENQISFRVLTEGGSDVSISITSVDLNQVQQHVDDFITGVQPEGFVAVDKTTTKYPNPLQYNDLLHFDLFSDYRPYKQQLNRWLDLDTQLNIRCEGLKLIDDQMGNTSSGASSFASKCEAARYYLIPNIFYCAKGPQWEDCTHPYNVTTDSGTNFVNELNTTIPDPFTANSQVNVTSSIPYFQVKKRAKQRPKTATKTANACLPHNACLINTDKQYTGQNSVPDNVAVPGSYVYVERHSTSGGSGSHTIYPSADGSQCLRSTITVKTPKKFMGKTYAWYEGSQVLHGTCAAYEDFYIIP